MKAYEYRGFDREGRPRKGLVDAISIKDAREKLLSGGILADRVAVTGKRLQFPAARRAMIYRELSALLGSGMPLVRALDMLMQSPELGDSRILLAGVRDSVKEGSRLADAMAAASDSVSAFEKATIDAAERSATVEMMLDSLASFIEDQEDLRDKVQHAMIYPTIVLAVGICVAIIMLGVLVPKIKDLLASSRQELPWITRAVIFSGNVAAQWGIPFLLGVAGLSWYLRTRYRSDEPTRLKWDAMFFRAPILGSGYALLVNLRFCRTLQVLIRGGVSLIDGLVLSGRATGSPSISRMAEEQAEAVRHGRSLSDAVRAIGPLSESLPAWIQTGEASGTLEKLLAGAGDRYQAHWNRFVAARLALLEPVLILAVAAFVLVVVVAVLLPLITMTQTIGRS
ncbi:MAG: hypothetical protein C0404_14740 [Verrucomicrobia bacterium]|nr:hypothetical protein [Verrucomicrobiota bacterium]